MKHLLLTIVCLIAWTTLPAQDMRQDTYCNPLNIDYTYMICLLYTSPSPRD